MHAGTSGGGEGQVEEGLISRHTEANDVPSAVLDTNLFVAAFWNRRSASAGILNACSEGRVRLYYTEQIRREMFLILRNIRATEHYKQWVESILNSGTEVRSLVSLDIVKEDPDDNKFLECAMQSDADYLVTNDEHLLRFHEFRGTLIVRPSQFKRVLEQAT